MRRYIDLGIDSRVQGLGGLEGIIEIACSMGFAVLGVKLDPQTGSQGLELLRGLSKKYGVGLVPRVDLMPRSRTYLLRDLAKYRDTYEVIAVRTASERLCKFAVQDDRVDLISLASKASAGAFSPSVAKIIAPNSKALEIELGSLILSKGQNRVELLYEISRRISLARRFQANLVISSGAVDKYLLRSPLDLVSVACLLSMKFTEALDSLSRIPESIVDRNQARLDPRHISPGVDLMEV